MSRIEEVRRFLREYEYNQRHVNFYFRLCKSLKDYVLIGRDRVNPFYLTLTPEDVRYLYDKYKQDYEILKKEECLENIRRTEENIKKQQEKLKKLQADECYD